MITLHQAQALKRVKAGSVPYFYVQKPMGGTARMIRMLKETGLITVDEVNDVVVWGLTDAGRAALSEYEEAKKRRRSYTALESRV